MQILLIKLVSYKVETIVLVLELPRLLCILIDIINLISLLYEYCDMMYE